MSQRTWTTKKYEVCTGWDRPLQYHFLVIQYNNNYIKNNQVDADMPIFSNLDLDNSKMTFAQIENTLKNFNIVCPETLIKDLFEDCQLDRGNYNHNYGFF